MDSWNGNDLESCSKHQLLQFLSNCSKEELCSLIKNGFEQQLFEDTESKQKLLTNSSLYSIYEPLKGGPYYKKYISSVIGSTYYVQKYLFNDIIEIITDFLPSEILCVWLWAEYGFNANNKNNIFWKNNGVNSLRHFEIFKLFKAENSKNNKRLNVDIKCIKNESTLNNRSYIKIGKNIGLYSRINQCITDNITNGITISFLFRPNIQNNDDCAGIGIWNNINNTNHDEGTQTFSNNLATFRFVDELNNKALYCGKYYGSTVCRTKLRRRLDRNKWNWIFVTFAPNPINTMIWYINKHIVSTQKQPISRKYNQINFNDGYNINGDIAWFAVWHCFDENKTLMNAVQSFLSDYYHFDC